MDVLSALEQSGFATWVRESSSLFSYPTILFLHTVGLGLLVGANVAIDLRILGFAPGAPVRPMERLFPVMWIGFWISALSGFALAAADATTMLVNPVFYIKLGFIALALVNLRIIRTRLLQNPDLDKLAIRVSGRWLAYTSLALWMIAITAGRLTAYLGPSSAAY